MTDIQYNDLQELVFTGGGWEPANQNAQELMDIASPGTIYTFKEVTGRDLKRLRCYFSLLNYIWEYMPDHFKIKVPVGKFYLWLKHLRGLVPGQPWIRQNRGSRRYEPVHSLDG